jgi:CRP-like cAMP-binding protein
VPVEFEQGQLIIRKGDVGDTFYIITEGSVNCSVGIGEVSISSFDKAEPARHIMTNDLQIKSKMFMNSEGVVIESSASPHLIARSSTHSVSYQSDEGTSLDTLQLHKGDWFGEVALLSSNSRRTANVVASSPIVKLLAFNRDSFEKALGSLKDIIDKKSFLRCLPLFEGYSSDKVHDCFVSYLINDLILF